VGLCTRYRKAENQQGAAKRELRIGTALLVCVEVTDAAPVVCMNKALFLADLAALGHGAIRESLANDAVWADSRNSIVSPGAAPAVTSQGINAQPGGAIAGCRSHGWFSRGIGLSVCANKVLWQAMA
jgi:hypothetical protein